MSQIVTIATAMAKIAAQSCNICVAASIDIKRLVADVVNPIIGVLIVSNIILKFLINCFTIDFLCSQDFAAVFAAIYDGNVNPVGLVGVSKFPD